MFLYELMKSFYSKSFEIVTKITSFKCLICRESLNLTKNNLFYCSKCDLYQFRPQPNKFIWRLIYFRSLSSSYKSLESIKHRRKAAISKLRLIENYAKKGKIFEIGPNGGLFLYQARKNGWHVEGNEISFMATKWAKKIFNLEFHRKFFIYVPLQNNSYNAFVMSHVLEHTYNPLAVLKKVYKALRPEGVLAIFIPNKSILQIHESYELFHMFEFQKRGLQNLLSSIGFEKVFEKDEIHNKMNNLILIYKKPNYLI